MRCNVDKIKKAISVLKGMATNREKNVNKLIMGDMLNVLGNEIAKLPNERTKKYEVLEGIGWAYADCCVTLDEGNDPRQTDMGDVISRAEKDLGLS